MKFVQYLTRQNGEFAYTERNIVEVYDAEKHKDVDFSADAGCIMNNDCWMHVDKVLYAIELIEIPEWMEPKEYDALTWMQYTRIGGNEELGRETYKKLTEFILNDERLVITCLVLLNTKRFRNAFRQSLRDQIVSWINGENSYPIPLTQKQRQCVERRY